MEQKNAARERLAQIRNRYFKGISLTEVALLKTEDEIRAFALSQVDRLLTEKQGGILMAIRLSDEFWTTDKGRIESHPNDPLMDKQAGEDLTFEEAKFSLLIIYISTLCHDLGCHYAFKLKETLGFGGDFWTSNKKLVEWLKTTPYEHIAMHTAYILKRHAIKIYSNMLYQPAQDEVAVIFSEEYNTLIRHPEVTTVPPRAYVKAVLDSLIGINRHLRRGRLQNLNPEVVRLHDDIFGCVPRHYDKRVLEAAQVLYDYIVKEVRGRLYYDGPFAMWDEMPQSYRDTYNDVMGRCALKVREVRDLYLGEGWLEERSLAFGYVMAQAEYIGCYMTSEKEGAL